MSKQANITELMKTMHNVSAMERMTNNSCLWSTAVGLLISY